MSTQNCTESILPIKSMATRGRSGGGGGSRGDSGGGGARVNFKNSNLIKYAVCLVLLNLFVLQLAEGQFFTKSAKSIPRMGRRSLPDYRNELEAYQQLLADGFEQNNLINESQEAQKSTAVLSENGDVEEVQGGGEVLLSSDRNQKLSDLLKLRSLGNRTPRTNDEINAMASKLTRDERAAPRLSFLSYSPRQALVEATREQVW